MSKSGIVYLLWSGKRGAWWGPDRFGYQSDIAAAGRYTEDEAIAIVVQSALCGNKDQVTRMVAAPDNWERGASS